MLTGKHAATVGDADNGETKKKEEKKGCISIYCSDSVMLRLGTVFNACLLTGDTKGCKKNLICKLKVKRYQARKSF